MENLSNKKYKIITYGCQMNLHESEKLAGILTELGYTETKEDKNADIIVFNTCCIRENAENHAEGNIGALKPLKKKNKNSLVGNLKDGSLRCYFGMYVDRITETLWSILENVWS